VGVNITAKTAFRANPNGFNFPNSWTMDATEKAKILDLIHKGVPTAMAALGPILAPAFGVADVIGALVGIPPGTLEIGGLIAVVSGALDGIIKNALPQTYGLCGGMAWASLDYWKTKIPINRVDHVPTRDNPTDTTLRNYIWERLIVSFESGVAAKMLEWMALLFWIPEKVGGGAHELLNRTKGEFEQLKVHIDKGEPWPISLVGTTKNPSDNHQILVYGYEEKIDGTNILFVYDNNFPNQEITITLNFNGNELSAKESGYPGGFDPPRGPLKGFFIDNYSVKTPPH